jgi:hypothetical protein
MRSRGAPICHEIALHHGNALPWRNTQLERHYLPPVFLRMAQNCQRRRSPLDVAAGKTQGKNQNHHEGQANSESYDSLPQKSLLQRHNTSERRGSPTRRH